MKLVLWIMIGVTSRRCAYSWSAVARRTTRLFSSSVDEFGRRIRTPQADNGWDDFDPLADVDRPRRDDRRAPPPRRGDRRDGDRRRDDRRGNGRRQNDRRSNDRFKKKNDNPEERKVNLKALEGAGFVHLYGLSSVLNALEANRRDFTDPEVMIDLEELEGEDYDHEMKQRQRKPAAQFRPYLFVQESRGPTGRASMKAAQADRVLELAEERGVPIAYVDKGVLNTLSGDRPHQGYVLRCGKLDLEPLSEIPSDPSFWLVLDEVVDPQNLGALLRSAYFLGGTNVGVLTCAKNSAPPSATVSAASAGALEAMPLFATSNLPRTLAAAERDGFRIVGASSSVPRDLDAPLYELQNLPPRDPTTPTILVMGSEGHGLRNLVAKSCTEFVRIPGQSTEVDSLNVSVSGGILLWHFTNAESSTS